MDRFKCPTCDGKEILIEKSPFGYSICSDCDTKWRNLPKEEIFVQCCHCNCQKMINPKEDKWWFLVKDQKGYHYFCTYKCLMWYRLSEGEELNQEIE